jgi:hypothetical protein
MQIPKRFKLLGRTITVEYDPMLDSRHGLRGEARYTSDTIALQPTTDTFVRSPCHLEQTFLHEMVHFILEGMNEHDLRGNEKFVDNFSALLHQALTTAEYEEDYTLIKTASIEEALAHFKRTCPTKKEV